MNTDAYKLKYLKYKMKYLRLKEMMGGDGSSDLFDSLYIKNTTNVSNIFNQRDLFNKVKNPVFISPKKITLKIAIMSKNENIMLYNLEGTTEKKNLDGTKLRFFDYGGNSSIKLPSDEIYYSELYKKKIFNKNNILYKLTDVQKFSQLLNSSNYKSIFGNYPGFLSRLRRYANINSTDTDITGYNDLDVCVVAHVVESSVLYVKITNDLYKHLSYIEKINDKGKVKRTVTYKGVNTGISYHDILKEGNYINIYPEGFGNNNINYYNMFEIKNTPSLNDIFYDYNHNLKEYIKLKELSLIRKTCYGRDKSDCIYKCDWNKSRNYCHDKTITHSSDWKY